MGTWRFTESLARVAHLMQQECRVEYHPGHAWRILRQLGWSCQRPAGRALERDEAKIQLAASEWSEQLKNEGCSERTINIRVGCSQPRGLSRSYYCHATLMGALASTAFSPRILTLICLGLASAFFGSLIFSTPLS